MPGTKRVINIGTNPDDGTGDLLRDALNKVNLNFDDVWEYTSVNSNLNITGDSINGTTDVIINPADSGAFKVTGDTIINPNGGNYNFTINGDLHNNVLYVQASTGRIGVHNTSPTVTLDITGDTKVSGMTTANNLTVTGNTILGDTNTDTVTYNAKAASDFLPFSTTQNIGAPSNRWGYIYTTNLDVSGTIAGTFTGSMTSTLTGDVNNTNVTTVNLAATGPSNLTDVNISGNLVVQGTTTTLETSQVLVDNSIVFEGATDDAFETTLQITDPTADRTFTFPDATGTVATQEWTNAQGFGGGGGGGASDTDGLTEGTTNLYFTNARADARIVAAGSANWNIAYGWGDHSTAGYLTSFTETNDLSSAVTWANVPDTNITASAVTQHQAALSVTKSQISDLATSDTDFGSNKITYSNHYANESDLPNASTYHGMFAHVHATGKGYFAHGGVWIPLQNESALTGDVDTHLNTSSATSSQVLSWNGSDYAWVSNAGGSGLSNVVDDTTPQLGGTLDANGNTIDMGTNVLTDTNLGQFITAYGWGDHGSAGYLTSVPAQSFASLTGKPTTVAGYGITDAASIDGSNRLKVSDGAFGIVEAANFIGHADETMYLSSKTTGAESTHIALDSTSGVATTMYGAVDFVSGGSVDFTGSTVTGLNAAIDSHLNQSGPTSGYVLSWNGSDYAWVANGSGGATSINTAGNTGTGSVTFASETLTATGTTGQINVDAASFALSFSLDTNLTGLTTINTHTIPSGTGTISLEGDHPVHSFNVSNNGATDYVFSDDDNHWFPTSANDPELYLRRGETYNFVVTAGASHPFEIRVSDGGSAYNTGVTNNGTGSGTIVFKVPMSAPATLYYQCTNHSVMGNTINIV